MGDRVDRRWNGKAGTAVFRMGLGLSWRQPGDGLGGWIGADRPGRWRLFTFSKPRVKGVVSETKAITQAGPRPGFRRVLTRGRTGGSV